MRRAAVPAAVLALVLGGCTDGTAPGDGPSGPASDTSQATAPADPTQAPSPDPQARAPVPPVRSPVSLPALMQEDPTPTRIRSVEVEVETEAYTRTRVTYRSGDLTVSGVLLRPRGRGPFPGIVLNHGYIDPAYYTTGQGLAREQDWLARAGFAVLHTDYRGHWTSDQPTGTSDRESRLGYTRDAINAVRALRREPYVDPERLAMLGRSMGGGVTLNALVARPGLVDAAVIYASVSSRFVDNLRTFTLPNRPAAAQALFRRFGTPRQSPSFYRGLSPRTYFDRVSEPVLIHHGTSDDTCPIAWSRSTHRLLQAAGADSTLVVYDGEEHAFVPQWQRSIEQTVGFLRRHLGR